MSRSTLIFVIVVLVAAVFTLTALLLRARRQLEASGAANRELQSDLAEALRPPAATHPAERTVRRVVRTVGQLRTHGVTGLLQASLEDLMKWAVEERGDILNMAASDGTVTLMFSDIENSTPLNERLGDREWLKVLEAHDDLVRTQVTKHHGQVVKTAGDSFMVAFREPEAACRAALGVQKHLARGKSARLRTTPIRVRIGVHTGRAVAREGDYFGRNVAVAARVAAQANGGQVLATAALLEAIPADAPLAFSDPQQVELKGLSGAYELWSVSRRRADDTPIPEQPGSTVDLR